ncbi:sulfite exporter TauE/SafE family protein [Acuticoccus sp. MNP-M23]|uniref:sulfite exporter TauE/SafE family protein n=1 Tax=Acuticoccus sp. MNP-M23 TaxID=3072793 RepID=UPI0028154F1A|nr:sulfite exporter TauE/SafE family protein [Acuticoccus sp. MNP-M23]WMS44154.1 sulfite exporter TauE/SafE family protein [Acuticoccus sp. MNP-M23]
MEEYGWLAGAIGLLIGGILKGATGAGAPIVAVPVLALIYDVPLAVAVFTTSSLLSNIWQGWRYRGSQGSKSFVWWFAGMASVGTILGSLLLVTLPSEFLMTSVSALVFLYIVFRLLRPEWQLSERAAGRIVAPAGFLGGMLQGAAGLSAPISLTFLTAMKMERARFIATVSVFFAMTSITQIPTLYGLGVMTPQLFGVSLLACIPVFGGMPIGAALAKRFSKKTFDTVMLAILAVVASRLVVEALFF